MDWIDIKNDKPNNLEIVLVSDGDWWYKAKFYKETQYTIQSFISICHGKELRNITHWNRIELPKK